MIVAPSPVFFLLPFLGFRVFVIFTVLFGEEAAPRGLLVLVPLAVVAVFLRRGRCRSRYR